MGKADDKGEPVKTVTIGGKKVEVPIILYYQRKLEKRK